LMGVIYIVVGLTYIVHVMSYDTTPTIDALSYHAVRHIDAA
jgi:hypothetical protein